MIIQMTDFIEILSLLFLLLIPVSSILKRKGIALWQAILSAYYCHKYIKPLDKSTLQGSTQDE